MSHFPDKPLIQKIIPWLLNHRKNRHPPVVVIDDVRGLFGLDETDYQNLFHWFFRMKIWKPIGAGLEITDFVEEFERRFGVNTNQLDFHLLHRFSNERLVVETFRASILFVPNRKNDPSITLKAILTFGDKTSEGRLIEAVGVPWFNIIEMMENNPDSIYDIDPFTWEEIIAGAYDAAGFDEVILTPRSGDKGRDVIAIQKGVGSIKIVDQVKAYKPGHRVPANDVRALLGVITNEKDVSKGIITTTSDFAPQVPEEFKEFMPTRLELRPKEVLIPWLQDLVKKSNPPKI